MLCQDRSPSIAVIRAGVCRFPFAPIESEQKFIVCIGKRTAEMDFLGRPVGCLPTIGCIVNQNDSVNRAGACAIIGLPSRVSSIPNGNLPIRRAFRQQPDFVGGFKRVGYSQRIASGAVAGQGGIRCNSPAARSALGKFQCRLRQSYPGRIGWP